MSRLTRIISLIALGLGVIVFTVGIVDVKLGTYEAFLLAMGIIVAAIPEGLPATVTLSLAVSVQRLAQKGVLVKKLSILETLEQVSIICTDKSGTLTQNQMTVRQVWVGGKPLVVTGSGYTPEGEFVPNPGNKAAENDLNALLTAGMLCNNSRLNPPTPDHPHWTVLGDQTEAALRVVAIKRWLGGGNTQPNHFPRIHEIPFDARRKRMSTIHQVNQSGCVLPRNLYRTSNLPLLKGPARSAAALHPYPHAWRGDSRWMIAGVPGFYPPMTTMPAMHCAFWRWHIMRYLNVWGAIPPNGLK